MRTAIIGAVAACLGGVAACGGGFTASCDNRSAGSAYYLGTCRTWSGKETGDFNMLCTQQNGAFSSVECPTPATSTVTLVGRCDTDQLFGLLMSYYYYAPTFTAQTAQNHCTHDPSCQV